MSSETKQETYLLRILNRLRKLAQLCENVWMDFKSHFELVQPTCKGNCRFMLAAFSSKTRLHHGVAALDDPLNNKATLEQ